MRCPASEKLEIIRLVERSHLPIRRTLDKLGIPAATFYRWYDRYQAFGEVGRADPHQRPRSGVEADPGNKFKMSMLFQGGSKFGADSQPGTRRMGVAKIVEIIRERLPRRFGMDPVRNIQDLCPMNRGTLGARSLNLHLQQALNPSPSAQVEKFGWTFAVGDKVMQIENDYDKDVYNGDVGFVVGIDAHEGAVHIAFDHRRIAFGFGERRRDRGAGRAGPASRRCRTVYSTSPRPMSMAALAASSRARRPWRGRWSSPGCRCAAVGWRWHCLRIA